MPGEDSHYNKEWKTTGKLKDLSLSLELSFNFYHQELQDGLDYEIK